MSSLDWFNSYKNKELVNGNTIKDKNTNSFIDTINYSFNDSLSYAKVNKYPDMTKFYDSWILNTKDNAEKDGIDKKKIIFKPGEVLNRGDYIYWIETGYLFIVVEKDISPYYDNGLMYRCNNTMNWYTYKDNGQKVINKQPCAIYEKTGSETFQFNESIVLANGETLCIIQNNPSTNNFKVNDRFLFGKQPFKIERINNYEKENALSDDIAPVLFIFMVKDQISPLDDLDNNIADGLPVKDINNTNIVISPVITKIKVNHTQSYSVYKYDDQNNKLLDTFTITASGCDSSYYTLNIIDGNNFSINNLKGDGTQYLTVHCVDNIDISKSEDIKIRLAGRW